MKNMGLLIAAVVLAGLSGALYWSNHHPANESTTKASSSDVAPKILSLNQDDITKISIQKKDGEEIGLAKNDAGKWQITAPKSLGADKDAASSLLYAVSSLNSERLIDEKPADLSQYGLKQPLLTVNVTTKDNKAHEVLLGDSTPTGSGVFAKLEGDPRVFTIASYNKNSLDKGLGDLRDKRLLTADFDKVSQIELVTNKQALTFARNKEDWQILKPKPLRADNFRVAELVDKLKDAKMESSASDADAKKATSAFAAGSPVATAKVTDASGTQELQVRKNKDAYYAKSTVLAGVYKVPSDVGTGLDKTLDDFRNKKLFDFGYDEPNKIELRDGGKAYFLTKGGQDWWSDGKKMDSSSVQSLIDKIRGLSANKFPESGFSSPIIEATVTSNDGKRTEKVSIAKSGDHYIAKRENEPALYELDSSSVTDLQKAAADVKAAPPAEPAKPAKK